MQLSRIMTKNLVRAGKVVLLGITLLVMTTASRAGTGQYPTLRICQFASVKGNSFSCLSYTYADVPGSTVYVLGFYFSDVALVDVYFDTTEVGFAITDGNGLFAFPIQIPANAITGQHWITVVQPSNYAAAQQPFQVESNWSAFRYAPGHKADNPYENILSQSTVGDIDIAWSYPTGGAIFSSPAQLDTSALNVKNFIPAPSFDTYFGSLDGNVYDADGVAGTMKWKFSTNGIVTSSPTVSGGTVYVGSSDSNVYALNAFTGALNWTYTTGSYVFSSPAVADGNVYIGSNDFNIYALNASSGSLVWSFPTTNNIGTAPAVSNGLVYAGSDDYVLYALNAASGAEVWSATLETGTCTTLETGTRPPSIGSVALSSATIANGALYIGANNSVYAFNALTGVKIWSSGQLSSASCAVPSTPAVANGIVYVGAADNNIYALNARTGAILWSFPTGGAIDSSPAIANGVLYVGSGDGYVYALNASTGALLWSFATGAAVESSPTVANGTLYVGSDDNYLYAFNLAGGTQARTQAPKPDPRSLHPILSLRTPK